MDFSAATMQNGINILGYNFGKSHLAIKEIETTISKVVGRPISVKNHIDLPLLLLLENKKHRHQLL